MEDLAWPAWVVAQALEAASLLDFGRAWNGEGRSWVVEECQLEVCTHCRSLTLSCDAACDVTECQLLLRSE